MTGIKRVLFSRRIFLKGSILFSAGIAIGDISSCRNRSGELLVENIAETEAPINSIPLNKYIPNQFLELTVISSSGDLMTDGFTVPTAGDGMSCFDGVDGELILIRNHEIGLREEAVPNSSFAYDPHAWGSTTTIVMNSDLKVKSQYFSLVGTTTNCNGGKTPWGTWISCEESTKGPSNDSFATKPHGYAFEVSSKDNSLKLAKPLVAMGRFTREGVAVDPMTGFVYQTEDNKEGCFYRFRPFTPGDLSSGILEVLVLKERRGEITRTWGADMRYIDFEVEWVKLQEVNPVDDTLRITAFSLGGAQFDRGEGICASVDSIYFNATGGGTLGIGQIFQYIPNRKDESGGMLRLIFDITDKTKLMNPDSMAIAPWGDIIVCEDGTTNSSNRILGYNVKEDRFYTVIASEIGDWSGACFSPSGDTFFANLRYGKGETIALRGDWTKVYTTNNI